MRLLIYEVGSQFACRLAITLRKKGHTVNSLCSASLVHSAIKNQNFTAVILGPGLPYTESINVLKKIREDGVEVPIIAITDSESPVCCVRALDKGADDCLTKSVDLDELQARIRAVVRRSNGHTDTRLQHDRIIMELHSARVWLDQIPVPLKRREFDLLHEFLCSGGLVLSRNLLEQKLYGWEQTLSSNSIEVHIHHLRQKLYPELIKTVRGMGYKIGEFKKDKQ